MFSAEGGGTSLPDRGASGRLEEGGGKRDSTWETGSLGALSGCCHP